MLSAIVPMPFILLRLLVYPCIHAMVLCNLFQQDTGTTSSVFALSR